MKYKDLKLKQQIETYYPDKGKLISGGFFKVNSKKIQAVSLIFITDEGIEEIRDNRYIIPDIEFYIDFSK